MPKDRLLSVNRPACCLLATISLLCGGAVRAQDAAAEKKAEPPRVVMCVPLAVATGGTTKMVVRGWALDSAKEVRSSSPQVSFKVLSAASVTVPNGQDAKQIGDTQIELEVTVAAGIEPGDATLTVVAPTGESSRHRLLIGSVHPLVADSEPNDGFQQAQVIQIPETVDGQIHGDKNVDVFSFDIADPQSVTIEVLARCHGSGLDSLLTLFDHRGNIVAVNDDHDGTTDSRITAELTAGKYFVSLQDAHDHGGPAHPYRLVIQRM
ncbi:MAG: DVUA0089 family protein [Planctomycetaceae bacterium]